MEDKKHSFMDQLNLLIVGVVIGGIIGACFMSNYHTGKNKKAEKRIEEITKNMISVWNYQ